MSFRSKIMMVPVLAIGAGLAVWGVAFLWGAVAAVVPAVAAVFSIIMLTRNLLITSADSVDRMNRTVKALTDGKMDMTLRADAIRESGEVGALENGLANLALNHHNFNNDLETLVARAQSGEGSLTMETKNLNGGLREIALHINTIVNSCEKTNSALISALDAFTRGDFNHTLTAIHPGAQQAVEKLGKQLQAIQEDIRAIAAAAKEGHLTVRTAGGHTGEWARMASDLNAALEAVHRPVREVISALERIESASFSQSVSSYLHGDFVKIKEALERINVLFGGHLNELSSALSEISYGREVTLKRDYRGAFHGMQSAVYTVARSSERLASELSRAKAANTAAAARPARPVLNNAATTRPTQGAVGSAGSTVRTTFGNAVTAAKTALGVPSEAPVRPAPARLRPSASGIDAPALPINTGKVVVPSGAHEYNRKDFGKYK